ncbi:MAG: peptidoglycan-binding protein [Eubacteriales bacterium]|nr:peptidoglycan-binding protein [Eubacteriales bacterium]
MQSVIADNIVFRPASPGDKGENVRLIQEKLITLGYLQSGASGNYLDQTKKAILIFQKDCGLEPTGVADELTLKKLAETRFREIKPGETSRAVMELQTKLIDMGFLKTKATGLYKNQTIEAIKKFQSDNNLEATGIADVATQEAIYSCIKNNEEKDVISVTDGREYSSKDEQFKRTLTRASEGDDVKLVQNRLKELGFFDGPISGYYMNQTIAAVKRFQYFNGLEQDGVCNESTWNSLLNDSGVVDINSTPAPSPEPVPIQYAVTVDVKNQAVLVYERDENGNYTNLIKTMICSTGTVGTPSDVGEWITDGRRASWCYFPAFGSHAKYWTKINPYIAFHSVIYNRVDNMALSIKSYNKLGQRASHGCVRLMVSDSKWIYDNIKKGTVVTITEDLPYDEELRMSIKKPRLNKENMLPFSTPEPTAKPNYSSTTIFDGEMRDLSKKSTGTDVYWLQMKLKDLGYYKGTPTGSYYSGTFDAVKKFQSDNGINATGNADVETQKLLYKDILSTPAPIPVITPSPTPSSRK